jgi:hypothetical protein
MTQLELETQLKTPGRLTTLGFGLHNSPIFPFLFVARAQCPSPFPLHRISHARRLGGGRGYAKIVYILDLVEPSCIHVENTCSIAYILILFRRTKQAHFVCKITGFSRFQIETLTDYWNNEFPYEVESSRELFYFGSVPITT